MKKTFIVEFDNIEKKITIGNVEMTIETFFNELDYLNSPDGYEDTVWCTCDDDNIQDDLINYIDGLIKRNHKQSNILKEIKTKIKNSDVDNGPFFAMFDIKGKIEQAIYNYFIQQNVFFELFNNA